MCVCVCGRFNVHDCLPSIICASHKHSLRWIEEGSLGVSCSCMWLWQVDMLLGDDRGELVLMASL